jgi:pantoate--beta-alanine ligase
VDIPDFNWLNPKLNTVEIVTQKDFLKEQVSQWKKAGETIGFVPTMGALHEGHLDLVRQAKEQCRRVVVSIFVNPLQFNNAGDLAKYPRHLEADQHMLQNFGIDLLYAPSNEDFYTFQPLMYIDFGSVSAGLEGKMRPGHFSGVGIVVARLFHLVDPDFAYFGAKDLQQVAVIRTLVRDLDFPVRIVRCPTVREPGGLALSSRNARLSSNGKSLAENLYKALQLTASAQADGLKPSARKGVDFLAELGGIEVEYFHWVNTETMEILESPAPLPNEKAICIAAWVEGVRLIDNLIC